ncbi:LPS-assembly protein LptD [Paraglaciecola arctica]|uniref:LPS-assembly protein LptD n=1 Tax=Paraglaciecola arctica TaxID=1128911 RepID=UPI0020900463|nr:LPS assembly protein LptD [Paraglaciecola arctica]
MSSIQNKQLWFFSLLLMSIGLADAQEVCFTPLPGPNLENSLLDGQIRVKSEDSEINQDTFAQFKGKVEIDSSQVKIKADEALLNRQTQTLKATGNVSFQDSNITVSSENVQLNRISNELLIEDSLYQLNNVQGHGKAQKIALGKENGINLIESSFTTCPVDDEVWRIQASNIEIAPNQSRGIIKHARFYIKDVPVLYLPYFSFPINDERQSGILYPNIASNSSTGISLEQPIYWNIAPNYDLTFSPRLMSERGVQLKTEFRYLTEKHAGQANIEYLLDDLELSDDTERYFYRFVHSGQIGKNWRVTADINGLSDDNYIVDLGSDYYNRADTHLYKTLGISYFSQSLDVTAQFRDFEVLGDHADSYRALPEIRLNYLTPVGLGAEFQINSELAYFENRDVDYPTATRFHIAPTVRYPYKNQWSEFLAEATVMHTRYIQENIENTALDKNISRTLGQVKVFGSLAFERPASWFGAEATQTFEPKVQYLYTSFENQNNIGLYDTTRLFKDSAGLFRGQEFTGLDRISDNNQITVGLTSRFVDNNNQERFKLSLGQIFYLRDNQVDDASKEDDKSALAAELDWQIGSKWYVHTQAQVSTITDKVERSSLSLEYQLAENKIMQINHRYVRDLSSEEINQVGITASWPLAKNWQWVGRWYHDIKLSRTVESYAGLQYESCCWTVSFVAQRNLSNRFDDNGAQSTNEFESGFNVYFTTRNLLREGLFGYRRPYLLN